MELCDSNLLNQLLTPVEPPRRSSPRMTRREPSETVYEASIAKSIRRRCRCGVCPRCQENARWERIFQEKFADPYYYSRPPRQDSSLNW
jgi:hypothetical protein